jgi:hypothetical protein
MIRLLHEGVVERTFGWFGQSRRVSKDYEKLCQTSEALIYAAISRIMVRRLARDGALRPFVHPSRNAT